MSRVLATIILAATMLTACGRETGPPIVISDLRILAPMPGSSTGVAYMAITNNSGALITVQSVSSPQFERVEMHETTIEDGISRMRPLEVVEIRGGETARFEAGGKHLMLFNAGPDTNPGSPVTLEIRHDDGLLIVSATMQARMPAQ